MCHLTHEHPCIRYCNFLPYALFVSSVEGAESLGPIDSLDVDSEKRYAYWTEVKLHGAEEEQRKVWDVLWSVFNRETGGEKVPFGMYYENMAQILAAASEGFCYSRGSYAKCSFH